MSSVRFTQTRAEFQWGFSSRRLPTYFLLNPDKGIVSLTISTGFILILAYFTLKSSSMFKLTSEFYLAKNRL